MVDRMFARLRAATACFNGSSSHVRVGPEEMNLFQVDPHPMFLFVLIKVNRPFSRPGTLIREEFPKR